MSENLCQDMKQHIVEYRKQYPQLSDAKLAKKLDLTVSTLNRILNEYTNPSLDVILRVLLNTGNEDKITHYLKSFNPLLYEVYETIYEHNKEYSTIRNDHIELFANEEYEWLLNHIYTEAGLLAKEEKSLSQQQKQKLEELIELGLARRDEQGQVKAPVGQSAYKVPTNIILQQIRNSIKYYKTSEAGQYNNWLSFQTERFTDAQLADYKELLRKQYVERKEFIKNAKGGTNLFFTSVLSSTFAGNQDRENQNVE